MSINNIANFQCKALHHKPTRSVRFIFLQFQRGLIFDVSLEYISHNWNSINQLSFDPIQQRHGGFLTAKNKEALSLADVANSRIDSQHKKELSVPPATESGVDFISDEGDFSEIEVNFSCAIDTRILVCDKEALPGTPTMASWRVWGSQLAGLVYVFHRIFTVFNWRGPSCEETHAEQRSA